MRVLIAGGGTGGHLMPALAIAGALRAVHPGVEPVLVGARRGIEATLLPQRSYRYVLLSAEPLYRGAWWKNARWPFIAWRVLREAGQVLERERPALVVGTGGYAAGPALFAAHRRGIPIALQEQNAMPGLTTRLLARWATQVHLGFPEAERHITVRPSTRVFVYGNPISPPPRPPDFRVRARAELGIPPDARVLLVTGGSQGARAINEAIARALDAGALDGIWLLWSTGERHYEAHRRFDAPPRRQVRPFWDPITAAYGAADLVVARSGAMTTAELCAYGLPSVLVPFPHAAAGHQTSNARALEQAGAAVHLPEPALRGTALGDRVQDLLNGPDRLAAMSRAALARGQPDAAERIARQLLEGVRVK